MNDEDAIRRVRQRWAFARDNGEWDEMRDCFHPDATVRVIWYSGPVAGFLQQTIDGAARRAADEFNRHWLGNSRVWIDGDRAILETDAMVRNRTRMEGHLFDFTIHLRLYDRMERRGGEWRILAMDAIYEKDRLDPVVQGSVPADFFAGVDFTGPYASMAMTRWRTERRGREMTPGLPICGAESERELRRNAEAWLHGRDER